jgi:hypothetical protein
MALSIYPPTRAGHPKMLVYLIFQPIRRTAITITRNTGELLPRLFTLIRQMVDGFFLLRYYPLTKIFPLGSMVPFVVRTFLFPSKPGQR